MLATYQRIPSSVDTVDSVLVALHDRWLNEMRRFVEPAASAGAGFWDRWTAVRYLADQFRDHFILERALLFSLANLLRNEDAERLTIQAGELERLLSGLNQSGRHRGTGPAVADAVRQLMEGIAVWCAEFEAATAGVPRDILSENSNRLLEHVKVSGAVGFP
jgi:hypothetical protein